MKYVVCRLSSNLCADFSGNIASQEGYKERKVHIRRTDFDAVKSSATMG